MDRRRRLGQQARSLSWLKNDLRLDGKLEKPEEMAMSLWTKSGPKEKCVTKKKERVKGVRGPGSYL